jgi:NAD(P)-dependent dehydrogenase (short-subunit alcohol dehydrogenase family)
VSALAEAVGGGIGRTIVQAFADDGTLVAVVGVNTHLAREQESRTCRATHPSFPGLISWPEEHR